MVTLKCVMEIEQYSVVLKPSFKISVLEAGLNDPYTSVRENISSFGVK